MIEPAHAAHHVLDKEQRHLNRTISLIGDTNCRMYLPSFITSEQRQEKAMHGNYWAYCQECKKETLHSYEEGLDVEYDDMGYTHTYIKSVEVCEECEITNLDQVTKPKY